MERGLKHKPKRAIIIEQQIQETQITVINQNLDKINQLELIAEQNLAAAVQAQLALISTVETIKNNIRVNHFKNRWNQGKQLSLYTPSYKTMLLTRFHSQHRHCNSDTGHRPA